MLQAALADGTAHRRCVFEVFTRRLPPGRRYGVLAGTGRVLEALAAVPVRHGRARLAGRRAAWSTTRRSPTWRTTGSPGRSSGTPRARRSSRRRRSWSSRARSPRPSCWRRVVLSILNYDSAVASAASRMTSAAVDRPVPGDGVAARARGGGRRGGRAAVVAGFAGTSNLEAGRRYGLATIGTAAHAFTLLHDDERDRVRGAGRVARARARRCWSTPTTCGAASSTRWRRRARRSGRCGSTPATSACSRTRSARSSTRPAPGARRSRHVRPRRVRDRGARGGTRGLATASARRW